MTRRLSSKSGQRHPLEHPFPHLATVDEKITGEIHSRDGNRSERKEGRRKEETKGNERAKRARDAVVPHADTP